MCPLRYLQNIIDSTAQIPQLTAQIGGHVVQLLGQITYVFAVIAQSMESEKIERLACAIAGTDQDPHRLYYARVIAETQLRLALLAKAKIKLIVLIMYRLPAMRTLEPRFCLAVLKSLQRLRRLERYERRAFSRCSRAIRLINN